MPPPIRTTDAYTEISRNSFGVAQLVRRPADGIGRFQVPLCGNDETSAVITTDRSICVPHDLDKMYLVECGACCHIPGSGDVQIMLALDGGADLLLGPIVIPSGQKCSVGDGNDLIDTSLDAFSVADCDEIMIQVVDGSDAEGIKVNITIGPRTGTVPLS